jgi:hypothetical protein
MKLSREQVEFLTMVQNEFLPKYEFIPAMRYSKKADKWPCVDISGYISGLLLNGEYTRGLDADWLYDLREFYIEEQKKTEDGNN